MNATRRIAYIYIIVLLATINNLRAQDNRALLQKQVRINATSLSIDSLSRLITLQTGVFLSFNANKITAGKKISLQKQIFTVNEVLDLIKTNTGSGYKVYQDHVIFHGSDKVKPENPHAIDRTNLKLAAKNGGESTTSKALTKTAKKPAGHELVKSAKHATGKEAIKQPNPDKVFTQTASKETLKQSSPQATITHLSPREAITPSASKDTIHQSTTKEGTPSSIKTNHQFTASKFQIEKLSVPQLLNTPIRLALSYKPEPTAPRFRDYKSFNKNFGLYAETGLAVDEAIYLQPTITAGIPVIHAIFSWGTNFKASGFRYGLGSSIPIKDDWRIRIQVTTGKLKRAADFGVMINTDTLKGFSVKSDLHRISLQVEKPIGSRLILKAGPVFNLLKSTYLKNGNPIALNTVGFLTDDSGFYTVRPPYTLSNTFKLSESSSTKTWIGFQVSLFYRINFRI